MKEVSCDEGAEQMNQHSGKIIEEGLIRVEARRKLILRGRH